MKNRLLILSLTLFTSLLLGCGDDEAFSPAGTGGSSSGTNVPTSRNFVVLFDEPNPPVLTDDGADGGVVVQVTINAGDRLKLATVGATAFLDVDWGSLSATSCQIDVNGSCTITWTSNASFDDPFFPGSPGSPSGGDENITFTAWILGEESFNDLNGNGFFDDGDLFDTATAVPPAGGIPGADVVGPFLDLNHSRDFNATVDRILVPGNTNGVITPADGLYNGQNCQHSTLCSDTTLIYISNRAILSIREDTPPILSLLILISAPANNFTATVGSTITFTATATDPEDGVIVGTDDPVADDDITWSSSLDGAVPFPVNSNSITTNTLSVGTHVITATVTDSDGNQDIDTVTVIITP